MNISGYQFSGPYDPTRGFNNAVPAVYAIVDGASRMLDVGQTGDLNNRFPSHPRENSWRIHAQGQFALYIYRDSSENSRLLLESFLRTQYNPPCGER